MPNLLHTIAGLDEAGRGCLAGPVFAGAVVLPEIFPASLLRDSKILSEKKREEAFAWIEENAIWSFGVSSAEEIDQFGIKKSSFLAMQRALDGLSEAPTELLIDGNDGFVFRFPGRSIIRGDSLFPVISAASIVAKVLRDREMKVLSKRFPHFGFEKHKGYGTLEHINAIQQYGHTEIHRKTFDPLRTFLTQGSLF